MKDFCNFDLHNVAPSSTRHPNTSHLFPQTLTPNSRGKSNPRLPSSHHRLIELLLGRPRLTQKPHNSLSTRIRHLRRTTTHIHQIRQHSLRADAVTSFKSGRPLRSSYDRRSDAQPTIRCRDGGQGCSRNQAKQARHRSMHLVA